MTDDSSGTADTADGDTGIIIPEDFTYTAPFRCESGEEIPGFTLRYETYGVLDAGRSNAVFIPHALTGDHHIAGRHEADDRKPGWWDSMVGPGKPVDTRRFFVIGINTLGGCRGSTGPNSPNPATGRPYGTDFPAMTLADMVRAEEKLITHLGIRKLHTVFGGSMGGMKALLWATLFPDRVANIVAMACSARQNTQAIGFNEVGRNAIRSDAGWAEGRYDPVAGEGPRTGLAVARMMAHITYLSNRSLERKFGRERQAGANTDGERFGVEFQIESYLRHQGRSFLDRFDANTYLYITKAVDRFDLAGPRPLHEALAGVTARSLVIGFSSDWLYPPEQNREIALALVRAGKNASYVEIETDSGHDAFLLPSASLHRAIRRFLGTGDSGTPAPDKAKTADSGVFGEWIPRGARVLDLGCGRGSLLARLHAQRQVFGVGVEIDHDKASIGTGRGVNEIQGDLLELLRTQPDGDYDWVVCSRVLQELEDPAEVVLQALRVGRRVAVAFVNHGHWRNRASMLFRGRRVRNSAYPNPWYAGRPTNPISIGDFEEFCAHYGIAIGRRSHLAGDWKTPCRFLPRLFAGYGVYELLRADDGRKRGA